MINALFILRICVNNISVNLRVSISITTSPTSVWTRHKISKISNLVQIFENNAAIDELAILSMRKWRKDVTLRNSHTKWNSSSVTLKSSVYSRMYARRSDEIPKGRRGILGGAPWGSVLDKEMREKKERKIRAEKKVTKSTEKERERNRNKQWKINGRTNTEWWG